MFESGARPPTGNVAAARAHNLNMSVSALISLPRVYCDRVRFGSKLSVMALRSRSGLLLCLSACLQPTRNNQIWPDKSGLAYARMHACTHQAAYRELTT